MELPTAPSRQAFHPYRPVNPACPRRRKVRPYLPSAYYPKTVGEQAAHTFCFLAYLHAPLHNNHQYMREDVCQYCCLFRKRFCRIRIGIRRDRVRSRLRRPGIGESHRGPHEGPRLSDIHRYRWKSRGRRCWHTPAVPRVPSNCDSTNAADVLHHACRLAISGLRYESHSVMAN